MFKLKFICFWTKEKEAEAWGCNRETGNSQIDGKEQTGGKHILAGLPKSSETQKGAQ